MAALMLRILSLRVTPVRVMIVLLFCWIAVTALPAAQERDLYSQATAAMLDRSFPSHDVDYLLLDVPTRQVMAMRWSHAGTAIPVGSLLKPFVALAFAQLPAGSQTSNADSGDVFPAVVCHGKGDGCWRTGGHGSMHLEQALAQSCNAYFLALGRAIATTGDGSQMGEDALLQVAQVYGLPGPPQLSDTNKMPAMLIGVTPEWRIQPEALARAYAALTTKVHDVTSMRLLSGMKMAAQSGGTAVRVGKHTGGILAKTGTAPCVRLTNAREDRCRENGDGLAVLMTPAESPTLLLLVRERGTTGAVAAGLAGEMLTRIEETHAAH